MAAHRPSPAPSSPAGADAALARFRRLWAVSWAVKIGAGLLFLALALKILGGG
ncbi:MAG: hypothetical protein QXG65_01935 [Thermoplasmata archaeon]